MAWTSVHGYGQFFMLWTVLHEWKALKCPLTVCQFVLRRRVALFLSKSVYEILICQLRFLTILTSDTGGGGAGGGSGGAGAGGGGAGGGAGGASGGAGSGGGGGATAGGEGDVSGAKADGATCSMARTAPSFPFATAAMIGVQPSLLLVLREASLGREVRRVTAWQLSLMQATCSGVTASLPSPGWLMSMSGWRSNSSTTWVGL